MAATCYMYFMCCVVFLRLFLNKLVNRIKHHLGLLNVEYGTYGYYEHKGIPMSSVTHPIERLVACESYDNFRPDDVLVCTYPKTGTHFVGHIILSIYKEADILKGKNVGFPPFEPFELAPKALKRRLKDNPLCDLDSSESPRVILSHLPYNLLPPRIQQGQVKSHCLDLSTLEWNRNGSRGAANILELLSSDYVMITCIRNPKDVVCSMLPFKQKVGVISPDTTFDQFFRYYIEGKAPYGDYCEHLRQWYPHRNDSNILTLVYEDLLQDLKGNIRRVADFLCITLTQAQIDRVVEANLFKNKMKEVHPSNRLVLRKGICGGWKEQLTAEQSALCDEWVSEGLDGMTHLTFQYS